MKPWVYIAAPYTAPDPAENTRRAVQAGAALLDSDLVIPVVPHLTMLWHLIAPRPYEEWIAYDRHLLRRCDALVRLSGDSPGADEEVAFAGELGLPVFDGEMPLYDVMMWADARRRGEVVTA